MLYCVCFVSNVYSNTSGIITSFGWGREGYNFCYRLLIKYVVSVRKGFLFLFVLRIDCVILLSNPMLFPYNIWRPLCCIPSSKIMSYLTLEDKIFKR